MLLEFILKFLLIILYFVGLSFNSFKEKDIPNWNNNLTDYQKVEKDNVFAKNKYKRGLD